MPGLGLSPTYRLYQLLWSGLDWLYPPTCGGCKAPGSRWCQVCQHQTQLISPPICQLCGDPTISKTACVRCRRSTPPYTALRSWATFDGPIQHAIHRLKYHRDLGLGEALAKPLGFYLRTQQWEIDLIVPIPLGKVRMDERGYNQVALLSFPLALHLRLPYRPGALRRVRDTRSQVGLSERERKLNVKGAFKANPKWVKGRSVVLVDDVTTTGATLESAARDLLAAGAIRVFGLTLARSIRRGF